MIDNIIGRYLKSDLLGECLICYYSCLDYPIPFEVTKKHLIFTILFPRTMSDPNDGTVSPGDQNTSSASEGTLTVTIGATVPTGFEPTAAEEVKQKIGADAKISKDRGRIYFQISTDKLPLVSLPMNACA